MIEGVSQWQRRSPYACKLFYYTNLYENKKKNSLHAIDTQEYRKFNTSISSNTFQYILYYI